MPDKLQNNTGREDRGCRTVRTTVATILQWGLERGWQIHQVSQRYSMPVALEVHEFARRPYHDARVAGLPHRLLDKFPELRVSRELPEGVQGASRDDGVGASRAEEREAATPAKSRHKRLHVQVTVGHEDKPLAGGGIPGARP